MNKTFFEVLSSLASISGGLNTRLVRYLNDWKLSDRWKVRYSNGDLNTGPAFQHWSSNRPVFEWLRNLNVRFSNIYCIVLCQYPCNNVNKHPSISVIKTIYIFAHFVFYFSTFSFKTFFFPAGRPNPEGWKYANPVSWLPC